MMDTVRIISIIFNEINNRLPPKVQSGLTLWGFAEAQWGTPQREYTRFFEESRMSRRNPEK
jgi:hypothetical protein